MTSLERNNFADQENQAPEGSARGLLAPKRGKMALVNESAAVIRPVLGEISQNIAVRHSHQLLRPPKQQVVYSQWWTRAIQVSVQRDG